MVNLIKIGLKLKRLKRICAKNVKFKINRGRLEYFLPVFTLDFYSIWVALSALKTLIERQFRFCSALVLLQKTPQI